MFDGSGDIGSGWVYYFYYSGTSTPKTVYSDSSLSTSAGQSITSNSRGEFAATYLDGGYKVILKDEDGVQIYEVDNYQGQGSYAADTVNLSDYTSFDNALDSIGSTESVLYIDDDGTLTENEIVPSTLALIGVKGNTLTLGAFDLTINGSFEAGPSQVFVVEGAGDVSFGTYMDSGVHVNWFGAAGDNSTASATPIDEAIESLPSANVIPKLIFSPGGIYKIGTGDPAIFFDRPMIVEGQGAILDYTTGTGTAVKVGGATGSAITEMWIRDMQVKRSYSAAKGVASDTLKGTAWEIYNIKNSYFRNLKATGYAKGFDIQGVETGCGYNSFYDLNTAACLEGIIIDSTDHASSWCNENRFYGGRVSFGGSTYTGGDTPANITGSVGVNVKSTNTNTATSGNYFFGVCIEAGADRKIKCAGVDTVFVACRFDEGNWEGAAGNWEPYWVEFDTGDTWTDAGTAVITNTSHGLNVVVNDLVWLKDGGDSSDLGLHRVTASAANTLTLETQLLGSANTDIKMEYMRTNIEMTSEAQTTSFIACQNLDNQSMTDAQASYALKSIIIDPNLGYSKGVGYPTPERLVDGSESLKAIGDLRGQSSNQAVVFNLTNMSPHGTAGDVSIAFRSSDDPDEDGSAVGTPRTFAAIRGEKQAVTKAGVSGDLVFQTTPAAGSLATALTIKGGGAIVHPASELTIASGVITVTKTYHTVDTESDGASDDLDTISGGTTGQILYIQANNSGRTVVVKDSQAGAANLALSGDCTLDNDDDSLMLMYNGANWVEVACSANGA